MTRWSSVLVLFLGVGFVGAESETPRVVRIPADPPPAAGQVETTRIQLHFHQPARVSHPVHHRLYPGPYRPFFRSYYRPWYGAYYRPFYRPYYMDPAPLVYPPSGYFGYPGVHGGYRGVAHGIYRLIVSPPPTGGVVRVNSADLIFNVTPARALIFIDGKLIGSARDFATERDRYTLLDGEYDLRIDFPGYQPFETRLAVAPNRTLHLDIELKPE